MSERLDDRIRPEVTASSDRLLKRRAAPDELFASGCRSCVACSPAACKDETRRDGALIAARCANPRAALWPQRPHWPFATVRGMQQLVQNLRRGGLTWTSPIRPLSFRLRISTLAVLNGAQRQVARKIGQQRMRNVTRPPGTPPYPPCSVSRPS